MTPIPIRDLKRLPAIAAVVTMVLSGALPLAARAGDRPSTLLPNLVPLPAADVLGPGTGILPSFGYGYPAPPVAVSGCLVDEIVRRQARRCLRFETVVVNSGRGPFELVFRTDLARIGAYQVLYRTDGTSRARFAAGSEYHPTHAHFHLTGFYEAHLWPAGGASRRPLASGAKSGFCPEDGSSSGGGRARYRCIGDYRAEPVTVGQVVGISPGWSDAYRPHLPDQYIEISDVPDGRYILEIRIDPAGHVREANESDNKACSLIHLKGEDVEVLRADTDCPRDGADDGRA